MDTCLALQILHLKVYRRRLLRTNVVAVLRREYVVFDFAFARGRLLIDTFLRPLVELNPRSRAVLRQSRRFSVSKLRSTLLIWTQVVLKASSCSQSVRPVRVGLRLLCLPQLELEIAPSLISFGLTLMFLSGLCKERILLVLVHSWTIRESKQVPTKLIAVDRAY